MTMKEQIQFEIDRAAKIRNVRINFQEEIARLEKEEEELILNEVFDRR